MYMARKRRLRSSRPLDQGPPKPKDPFGFLPNTCAHTILEYFTAVELIGMQRVSRGWKEVVDWRLAGIVRKCGPELAKGANEEESILEFRRES